MSRKKSKGQERRPVGAHDGADAKASATSHRPRVARPPWTERRFPIGFIADALHRPRVVRLLWMAVLVFVVLSAAWWWHARAVPLPQINMGSIDPKVATSLQQRMDEVRRHPRSAEAWGWLGALLWAYDFRPAACQCLSRAARLEPANPRWPYYHALALIIATPDEAIPFLQQTVRLCGNSPEAPRFRLARLLAERGRWDEAGDEIKALLAERPDFAPARLLAARSAHARGELDQAAELARSCTDDLRTARSAWILLATVCRQKGDSTGAQQAAQRSVALPEDEGFGDPYEAEANMLRGDPRVLSEQAHLLLAGGHLAEAGNLVDRLNREHPDYAETWLLVGRLHLLKKELGPAEKALRKHLQLNPRSAQGLFQLGLVLLAQERFADAAPVFDRATELKPDYGPAYYNRGFALGRSGQVREAIAAFRESLRHNPEHFEAYVLLADLHLRLGERAAAQAVIDQAEALKPGDPRLLTLRNRVGLEGP
ncbi:MAG TPA: tetratricopeptide repeat protein [Verrucomicrobiae bacterium]